MIITSSRLSTVCFEPSLDLLGPYETEYDYDNHLLNIKIAPDCTSHDLARVREIEEVGLELLDGLNGCYDLMDTVVVNNVEYVQGEIPVRALSQYLVADRVCKESGIVMYEGCCNIVLRESDINQYTSEEPDLLQINIRPGLNDFDSYCDWVNADGSIYVRALNDEKIQLTNIYQCPFDGQTYNYIDGSIAGLIPDFNVNDVKVFARFIEVLKEKYPTINFYTNPEDKNSTEYNEWICYKMEHRVIKSQLFSNHVFESPIYGRFWPTTLDFTLEYSTMDLPRLLARRDLQSSELFLNDVHTFKVAAGVSPMTGKKVEVQCALFWDRDPLEPGYKEITEQDNTGYSLNAWNITGRIIFSNVQFEPRPIAPIIEVLCAIIGAETKPKVYKHINLKDKKEAEPTLDENQDQEEEVVGVIL